MAINYHNAKGTPEKDYLDPVLFENINDEVYTSVNDTSGRVSARSDSLKMNREHMDYTLNGIRQMLTKIAKGFDLNGDGYIGIDDVAIIMKYYGLVSSGLPEDEAFLTMFYDYIDYEEYNLNEINYVDVSVTVFVPKYPNRLSNVVAQDGRNSYYLEYSDRELNLYKLPLYDTDYDGLNLTACKDIFYQKIQIIKGNQVYRIPDATTASELLYAIEEYSEREFGACLSIEEFVEFLFTKFNGVNLLMPQYARRVEVEDLDENFWVIGQALTFLMNGDFRVSEQIEQLRRLLQTKRESIEVPEDDYEADYNNLFDSDKEYLYTTHTIKNIHFEELTPTVGNLPSDYWCMFIINRSSETTTVQDLLLNCDDVDAPIKLLNPDLDITNYTVLNILFFYNGVNICAIVNGY